MSDQLYKNATRSTPEVKFHSEGLKFDERVVETDLLISDEYGELFDVVFPGE